MSYLILGISTCPYCTGAEQLLKDHKLTYQRLDMDTIPSGDTLSTIFKHHLNYAYVPMIFHDGNFIGGLDELKGHVAGTCACKQ